MAETSRLTIIAELKDDLTGPLRRVRKAIQENIDISKKAAYQASREGKEWERLAHQQKIWYDTASQRWKQGNRFIAQSKVAAAQARAHARATADLQNRMNRFHNTYRKFTAFMTQGNVGAKKRAAAWQKFTTTFTAGANKVTGAYWKMAFGMAKAGLHAQAAQRRFVNSTRTSFQRFNYYVSVNALKAQGHLRNYAHAAGHWATVAGSGIMRGSKAAIGGLANITAAAQNADYHLKRLGKASTSALGVGYGGAALGAGLGAGYALYGGMTRINALEAADVRLDVMDYDEGQREDILETINKTVTGTFVPLDQGATVGTQLLGAGVKEEDLERRMTTTVDVASLYGTGNIQDVATVLAQIQAKGKLAGEEALQLAERAMPVYDWVAEAKGVDKSEVQEMVTRGQVTAEDFWEAMEMQTAGGAQKMGETFIGAFRLMRTSITRAGQYFEEPLLDPMRRAMLAVKDIMDGGKDYWTSLGEALAPGFSGLADKLPQIREQLSFLGPLFRDLLSAVGDALPYILQGFVNWLRLMSPLIIILTKLLEWSLEFGGWALPILIPLLSVALHLFSGWYLIFYKLAPKVGALGVVFKGFFAFLMSGVSGLVKLLGVLRFAILSNPFGWALAAVIALGFGLKWLYDNVEPVRQAFDAAAEAVKTVVGVFDDWGKKLDELIEEKLPALHKLLTFGDGATTSDPRNWGERMTDATAHLSETLNLPNVDPTKRAENAERHRKHGFIPEEMTDPGAVGSELKGPAVAEIPELDPTRRGATMPDWLRIPGWMKFSDGDAINNLPGYASGGFTSGAASEVAGYVHGNEFVTNAWATNSLESSAPGGLAHANATGQWPATGPAVTYAPNVAISVGSTTQAAEVAAVVRAELARQARDMSRQYMTQQLKGAH